MSVWYLYRVRVTGRCRFGLSCSGVLVGLGSVLGSGLGLGLKLKVRVRVRAQGSGLRPQALHLVLTRTPQNSKSTRKEDENATELEANSKWLRNGSPLTHTCALLRGYSVWVQMK